MRGVAADVQRTTQERRSGGLSATRHEDGSARTRRHVVALERALSTIALALTTTTLAACGGESVPPNDAGLLEGFDAPEGFDAAVLDAPRDTSGIDANVVDASMVDADLADDAALDPDVPDAYMPPPVFERWVTDGIEEYVVPAGVRRVRIVADGASGGDTLNFGSAPCLGGLGAHVETSVGVVPGETLRVLVGRHPATSASGSDGCGASGGGGTFVVRGESEALAIAGGGGGASGYFGCSAVGDASLSPGGGDDQLMGAGMLPARGGTAGAGGAAGVTAGGGGGLLGDGAGSEVPGGLAFIHGGLGGARSFDEGCDGGDGGLGGGGGGSRDRGGGGGGYSGGASQGGGGGTIAMGSDTTITLRTERGDGYVRIEPL